MAITLGLPEGVRGCLFDLDGVLTKTAKVHAAAWAQMFDEFLRQRSQQTGEPFVPFDPIADYDAYVDGRPRLDGTRTFLDARGISLPEGKPDDPPDAQTDAPTVQGLSNRKNELVQERLKSGGVETYDGSVAYVRAVRDAGLHRAVVSSSANTAQVLRAAGIEDLFETRIDGQIADERHLAGKPAPDFFLAGAQALGLGPSEAAVFEDALAGVAAGRAGHFAFVVGVDRSGQADELRKHGADIVVRDLAELMQ